MSVNQDTVRTDVVDGPIVPRRSWNRIFGIIGVLALVSIFSMLFYKMTFVGLTDRHAMDIGQISRNIASGNGFTTRFIRPFNIGLMKNQDIRNAELNNAPLFPYMVAVLFKLKGASDQEVAWISLLFLILTTIGTYFLGKVLFDWRTGLLSSAVIGISASVLKAAISGTEWTMAAFWLLLLLLTIAYHHRSSQRQNKLVNIAYPIAAGILLALLYMTNHILVFLIIPIAIYFAITGSAGKLHLIVFLVISVLAIAPWAYRNTVLTGAPVLGVNAWDIFANTKAFPGDTFYRTADSANRGFARVLFFPIERFSSFTSKLIAGSSDVLQNMGVMLGLLVLPFALVSMLYRFKIPATNAIRGLSYGIAAVLIVCFALFSIGSQSVIILAPIIAVFSAGYFFLLLDAKKLHPVYTQMIIAAFVLITFWPAFALVLESDQKKVNLGDMDYIIGAQKMAGGLVYTDEPWIGAWRGDGIAVWLPRTDEDISELSAAGMPMRIIVLTAESGNYSPDEAWYLLHKIKLWRDYVNNPDACLQRIKDWTEHAGRKQNDFRGIEMGIRERKRALEVCSSLGGLNQVDIGPFAMDGVQVFIAENK